MNSEQAHTDAFLAFEVLSESHQNEPKATPLEKLDKWLPKVHIVTSNFKSFLAGTSTNCRKSQLIM